MKIRHLSVRRFRGIAQLDWSIRADVVCLVGPGDATKTTILDAISYALTPRWFLPITDADFYGGVGEKPIEIRVTVTAPPTEFLQSEAKFGDFLRGWSPAGEVHDDPADEDEHALTIRLVVDPSLEPVWTISKDSVPEGKAISSTDRAKMRVFRVDERSDYHLGWGRGSALAALTGDLEDLPEILADAHRAAREAVFEKALPELEQAAASAHTHAADLGVSSGQVFQPGLDPRTVSQRSALVLFDGQVPANALGLGSRRLAALAVQRAQISKGSIVIVDEVELGLEPHRLRHLLSRLKSSVQSEAASIPYGQVFLGTHSPVTVSELAVEDVHVVRSDGGTTKIVRASEAFSPDAEMEPQALVRAGADAILAKRIVVCEGKTEIGFFRALAKHWDKGRSTPLAHEGTVPTDGGGEQAGARALGFATLGYPTALLIDSDKVPPEKVQALELAGVQVVQWSGHASIEQRVALDLTDEGRRDLLALAVELKGGQEAARDVRNAIRDHLPGEGVELIGLDPSTWISGDCTLEIVGRAIGAAAKSSGWFKRIDRGQRLGQVVVRHLSEIQQTDLARKITALECFSFGPG